MGSLYRKDVIDIALEQDGYQGNGKWCKYTEDLDAINYFNMGAKNGSADWCSIFVNWCIYMSTRNASGQIEPDKWDAHYFTFEPDSGEDLAAACGYAADYYMAHDAWSDDCQGACRGDQVFFRNFAHTGLVTGYDDEGIYTIEGNIDGSKVGRRYYKFDDPSIDGFGHPRYDGDVYPGDEEAEPDPDTDDKIHTYNCVDVSEYNGVINWKKAKNDGVEYAFIRCGLGKYYLRSNDFEKKLKWEDTNGEDRYFVTNLKAATEVGIKVGVFFYSYATTNEEAFDEAIQCINEISKYKDIIDFPVFMDVEEKFQESVLDVIIPAFIQTMNEAGYNCGVYTSGTWYDLYFKNIDCDYIWLAYWGQYDDGEVPSNSPSYYDVWQYTSHGTVDGIGENCVDCDILYNTEMHLLIDKPVTEPTPKPEPEPVSPPVENNKGTVYTVCVGSWLNIRTEPTSESIKIGELYDGAKVIVYEQKDGWARIGDNMWVFADFLE